MLLNVLTVLIVFPIHGSQSGASQQPLPISRAVDHIEIDGVLSEATWDRVAPLPLTMYKPIFNGALTERTEIWVTYDAEYLFVGAAMYDSHPEGIQAYSLVRDVDNGGDFLNILLDTFNDNQNAVIFTTTPGGARIDWQIQNDAEGPSSVSASWNTFWDAAVTRDELGWYAEMRIPFTSLRFQDDDGRVVMGLIVNRLIGQKNERHIFPAIQPNWALGEFKPSQGRDILLEGVYSRRPIRITPYLSGDHQTTIVSAPDETRFRRDGSLGGTIGGDIKFGVTNSLNLDLTFNTDFAEVEADEERVNLTRFSLFFPEQRQFFLERQGIFDFGVAGIDRPFYSRRIGLTESGESVDIVTGARLTGRIGGWDLGVLDMQTSAGSGQPSENMSAFRARGNVLNQNSYIGFIGTSRVSGGGRRNALVGADTELSLGSNDYLTLDLATTFDSEPDSAGGIIPESQARLTIERRSLIGLGFGAGASLIGGDYRPGLGFVERRGIGRMNGSASFGMLTPRSNFLRQITPRMESSVVFTNGQRNIESWEAGMTWSAETLSGAVVDALLWNFFEDLGSGFALSETVDIPSGTHRFHRLGLRVTPAQGWRAGSGFFVATGGFFDGSLFEIEVSPFWNISPHLRLAGEYRYDRARFESRSQRLDAHIVRLRVQAAVDSKLSAVALFQVNTVADLATANVRVRYNIREGNDLWIAYVHLL
ncbi:MAG: carbohydrate binding family 9 domain-containing protein, partial [Gemmatimonadetes bacterium]|nr:carbohydrate binding family 9 domain-containing protein [Gemmatimonadota bacterium]